MRKRTYFRFWWVFMLVSVPVLMVDAVAIGYAHYYSTTHVPPLPALPETSYVYAGDGRIMAALHGEINRTEVAIEDMPGHLLHAVIAAEDKDFYEEGGVSLRAIMRAAWTNATEFSLKQGGSTITQQFVKNAITGSEKSFSRKIREAILAQKLARMYSKNDILERYLNTVYFGHGAYGVQAAAQTYFGVDVGDLTQLQSATLAGLIPAPASYDPIRNPIAARLRRDIVLRRMTSLGYLSRDRAAYLSELPLRTYPAKKQKVIEPYFVEYVKDFLQDRYGPEQTFGGGLQITTTLDFDMQRAAERAVRRNLDRPTDPSASLVAIEPHTGDVVALVGGNNFKRSKFNLATQARRQTGSAFKMYTLAAALKQGMSLDTVFSGPGSMTIPDSRCLGKGGKPWQVGNYGDSSAGTMSLASATAYSVNTIFAQLVVRVGPDKVANLARRMGIETPLQSVCSITLGSQSVTPLEMTAGFATVAARGVRRGPYPVETIATSQGKLLYQRPTAGDRALDKRVADLVTHALQGVVGNGTGTAAAIGRPVAGKTGTAQNYQDAWFCGYVPQLAACVWVGHERGPIPMLGVQGFDQVYGGSIPALIWRDFMVKALAGQPVLKFADPFARPEPTPTPTFDEIVPPAPFSPEPFSPEPYTPPPYTPTFTPEPLPEETPEPDPSSTFGL